MACLLKNEPASLCVLRMTKSEELGVVGKPSVNSAKYGYHTMELGRRPSKDRWRAPSWSKEKPEMWFRHNEDFSLRKTSATRSWPA